MDDFRTSPRRPREQPETAAPGAKRMTGPRLHSEHRARQGRVRPWLLSRGRGWRLSDRDRRKPSYSQAPLTKLARCAQDPAGLILGGGLPAPIAVGPSGAQCVQSVPLRDTVRQTRGNVESRRPCTDQGSGRGACRSEGPRPLPVRRWWPHETGVKRLAGRKPACGGYLRVRRSPPSQGRGGLGAPVPPSRQFRSRRHR